MTSPTADHYFNQAVQYHRSGELAEARAAYERCLALNPDQHHALANLGSVCRRLGLLDMALQYLRRAVALQPMDAGAHYNLANALRDTGDLAAAESSYRRAASLNPQDAAILYNLGILLTQLGREADARESYRQAIAANPEHLEARLNLAVSCAGIGEVSLARQELDALLERQPGFVPALNNLAALQQDTGQTEAALATLRLAAERQPDLPQPRSNLLMGMQYHPAAAQAELLNHARAWGEWASARAAGRELPLPMNLKPVGWISAAHPPSDGGCAALIHPTKSRISGSRNSIRATVGDCALSPTPSDGTSSHSTDETTSHSTRLSKNDNQVAGYRLAKNTSQVAGYPRRGEGSRALRVGYVSADLCMHPVGLFLKDVIAHHDPSVVTPVIYSNGNVRDPVFAAIVQAAQSKGGGLREIKELDDATLAAQICADEIDILVDLSGHTGKSRLAAFAWKPAPLQISWLGYFATTGLPAVDFVILDPWHAPVGTEDQFSEAIIRLPHNRFCYSPVDFAPEVSPPPFEKNGFITFGSFNNTAKLNDAVLDAWARILKAVPDSRLILKWRTFADAPFRRRVTDTFATQGIAAERIELRPMSSHRELLEQYADIDIALDPFPFSGGHTSCEALWMGVPVVTLPQERVVSRQTWSFLNNIGLPGLAAKDIDGYVQLAAGLASSPDTLKELRQSLRERMRGSPLCDVQRFTRLLEEAYRVAWQEVIGGQRPKGVSTNSRGQTMLAHPTTNNPRGQMELAHPTPVVSPADFLKQVRIRAEALMERLNADREQPDLWLELTGQMAALLRHEAVVAFADEVLQRRPDDPAALTLKGNALRVINKADEALACYRRVLELCPQSAEGYCNLGAAYQTLGRYPEAIAAYELAVALKPDEPAFWGNLAVSLTYSSSHTPADVLSALRRFDAQIARPLRDPRPHANGRDSERRLRIGYVSPDLRKHAVAYFALPLIEGHNKDQVEVFCYYNHRQDDDWTKAFKKTADHWLDCAGMGDAALAERIRADGIDILVDLSGHTENNRLLTFARKPAPVQVTWMGYVTTTGMSAMDWRVTHDDADPPGAEAQYSERLWRLPGTMWCYRPLPGMPEVSAPPFARNGHITFGSFNRYSKNSPLVLETWAQILNRVPDARLVICVPEGEIRQRMASFFSERGIAPERIAGFAKLSHEDFWKLHAEVDIALDPFPFGGGTTTCETLWLGVPVVTCTGKEGGDFAPRFASRMGYAFLNNIGLPELACETITGYIDTAVQLALDPPRLTALRQSLRDKMAHAPLTDEARFAGEMEQAYRAMWREWGGPE